MTLEDIQKCRYDNGAIVYNTNNYQFAVVIDGSRGNDSDPESTVLEISASHCFIVHTPPNRALIPTGRILDISKLKEQIEGRKSDDKD